MSPLDPDPPAWTPPPAASPDASPKASEWGMWAQWPVARVLGPLATRSGLYLWNLYCSERGLLFARLPLLRSLSLLVAYGQAGGVPPTPQPPPGTPAWALRRRRGRVLAVPVEEVAGIAIARRALRPPELRVQPAGRPLLRFGILGQGEVDVFEGWLDELYRGRTRLVGA